MQSDKHRAIIISLNKYDFFCSADSNDQKIDQKQYQQTIKSLMYVTIHIWSNIVFILN